MDASGSMAVSKPARTFQDLLVWQKAHAFVLEAYAFTALFPKQETYGLAMQMRRAAVSIPANIARRLPSSWPSRQGSLSQHRGGISRGMSLLFDPRQRPWIRRYPETLPRLGRSQQASQRIQHRHSGFLDF